MSNSDFELIIILFICIGILVVNNFYNSYMTKYRIKRLVDIELDNNKKLTDLCKMLSNLCNITYDLLKLDLKVNQDKLIDNSNNVEELDIED